MLTRQRDPLEQDHQQLKTGGMPPQEQQLAPGKPLLRGWLHATAALAACLYTLAILNRSAGHGAPTLPLLLFGLSMMELYAVSAFLHIGTWSKPQHRFWRALDHVSIYGAIAGTYTPFCAAFVSGWLRVWLLCLTWLLAFCGGCLTLLRPRLPRTLRTALYGAMGVGSMLLLLPALWQSVPAAAMSLLVLSGVLYLVGAIVYVRRWPDPLPLVFGYHELFHLLVIVGNAASALVVWVWVAPRL
jgi:hemolysin III